MAVTAADLGLPATFNAAAHFVDRNVAEGRGERIAIECGEERVSYAQLLERVNRFGSALRDRFDVRPEERVLLLLVDTPSFAYAFFGAIKIGAVPIPINTLWKTADYRYVLNDSRAQVLVVSQQLLPQLAEIPRRDVPALRHILVVPDGGSCDDVLDAGSPELEPEPTSRDAPAFWLYSSGSTGAPKACVHLQHDMVVCAELFAKGILGIRAGDRCFSIAKLFFAYGLGNGLYFPLSVGATTILCPVRPTPPEVYRIIETHRPTLFFAVPTAYGMLLAHTRDGRSGRPEGLHYGGSRAGDRGSADLRVGDSGGGPRSADLQVGDGPRSRGPRSADLQVGGDPRSADLQVRHDFDLSSVRLAVSAGEALPAALYERFKQRFGVDILDGIGSTEVLHMFISNRPGAIRPGSSGHVVTGYDASILDDEQRPVPQGEIGNLWVAGDSTCAYYWNQHEKTKETIRGDWIRTGDKYTQDADGYFWYAGRTDDMLKVGGLWVSPAEVENALVEHGAVRECAVVAREDHDTLVKPVAFVVLQDGVAGTPELASELQAFIRSKLAEYKRPRWVEFVSDLPKTATGKIQRYKLRESDGARGA